MFHLEPHDAKANRHKTMKKTIVILVVVEVLLFVWLDWSFIQTVLSRGGWTEWTEYNPFWSVALAYLIGFQIAGSFITWTFVDGILND